MDRFLPTFNVPVARLTALISSFGGIAVVKPE
jgi:hypothetical protein